LPIFIDRGTPTRQSSLGHDAVTEFAPAFARHGALPAVRDWLFAALIVGQRKVALHVHSVVQDSPDFDDPSGSYPVQEKVTSATTVSRNMERAKTPHDLVPGFGPTNLGTNCEFANRANERVPIASGLPRAEILGGPF
jgi:hypothetical protein